MQQPAATALQSLLLATGSPRSVQYVAATSVAGAASGPGTSSGGVGDGGGVAEAVACSLVAAFSELRQLEVLLRLLTEGLLQQQVQEQVLKGSPAAGAAGSAAAAAAVLRGFQAALSAAVRQVPSGQVPLVLRLAADAVAQLAGGSSSSSGGGGESGTAPNALLALDLYSACLASLTVDLTTAAAAATAAQELVAALVPLLLPLLAATANGNGAAADAGVAGSGSAKKEKERKQRQQGEAAPGLLLSALLRLYGQALAVHGRCSAPRGEGLVRFYTLCPIPGRLYSVLLCRAEPLPKVSRIA